MGNERFPLSFILLILWTILGALALYFSAWGLNLPLVLDAQFTILVAVFLGPYIGAFVGLTVGILIIVLSNFPPAYGLLILSQIGIGVGFGLAFRNRGILNLGQSIWGGLLTLLGWVGYESIIAFLFLFGAPGGYEDPIGVTLAIAGVPLPLALLVGSFSRRFMEAVLAIFIAHHLSSTQFGHKLLARGFTEFDFGGSSG